MQDVRRGNGIAHRDVRTATKDLRRPHDLGRLAPGVPVAVMGPWNFRVERATELRVRAVKRHQLPEERAQRDLDGNLWTRKLRDEAIDDRTDGRDVLAPKNRQDRSFVGEVLVERADRNARTLGDRVGCHTAVAALRQEGSGSLKDGPRGLPGARLARLPAHRRGRFLPPPGGPGNLSRPGRLRFGRVRTITGTHSLA